MIRVLDRGNVGLRRCEQHGYWGQGCYLSPVGVDDRLIALQSSDAVSYNYARRRMLSELQLVFLYYDN
jgi:hypothetical protein